MLPAVVANHSGAASSDNNNNNLTALSSLGIGNISRICPNGSVVCDCSSPQTNDGNSTSGMLHHEGSLDALLYIVVVLLFYAFSIVVLMVKYIRRENKEAYLRQYFDEFVAREHFRSARARNQVCLKSLMDKRAGGTAPPPQDSADGARGHGAGRKDNPGPPSSPRDLKQVHTQLSIPETISELAEADCGQGAEVDEDEDGVDDPEQSELLLLDGPSAGAGGIRDCLLRVENENVLEELLHPCHDTPV